ncbi:hypothetical protein BH11MYX3_BH11MYX3_10570 [soil metagenome]
MPKAKLELTSHRKPFTMLPKLPVAQRKQLQRLATDNDAGTIDKLVGDDDWNPMELIDVVDVASGKVTHQLYLWPGGSGRIFENNTTTVTASIIQHGYELQPGDLAFRTALAAAKPRLVDQIDFRLDEEAAPDTAAYDAARKRMWAALSVSNEGMKCFEAFSAKQRGLIREFIETLPADADPGLTQFGLPPAATLPRWASLAPGGVAEKRAAKWPVWKWLTAALHDQAKPAAAIAAITKLLSPAEISDLCLAIATTEDYQLFRDNKCGRYGETHASAHGLAALRLLGSLLDASGDDAAIAFARRARKELAKRSRFHLGAIATWALIARARRRDETFPQSFVDVAETSSTVGYGFQIHACPAYRDLLERMTPAQRSSFDRTLDRGFGVRTNTDHKNGREVRVPTLVGTWWYADLLPAKHVAAPMIEAITGWKAEPVPKQQVLDVVTAVGTACIPSLDRALAAKPKPAQHALLAAARKRLG